MTAQMMFKVKFRLTHTTRQPWGSSHTQHIWVGQVFNPGSELWEDMTNEYPTAGEAELALWRNTHPVEFDPVFEH